MTKWGERMAKEIGEPKPTEEQIKRMVEIGERMGKCMQRAMAQSSN